MIELPNVSSLYVLLAFGISYWILKKYLFVPLSAILDARQQGELEAERAYAKSLAELEKAVAAGEQQLSDARREALSTRESLRAEGSALLEAKLAEAHTAAQAAIDRGGREIESQSTSSARELAEKILGRKLAA